MNPKLSLLFARRSVRQFQAKPVPDVLLQDLLEAAMAAPSACAKDPWRFVVVQKAETLAAIAAGLPNGKLLATAPLGIVVCGDLQAAHAGELSYLLQDCSAAIQNLLLAASALGLGGCWLGVHPRQERVVHIRSLLALPEPILPVAVLALGWPAESKEPRTRFTAPSIHHETW